MANPLNSKKLKSLLPYFFLALAVIIAFKVVSEIGFFMGIASRIWGIVTPFFYGFMLAYIINIPCGGIGRLLEKSKIGFIVKRKQILSILLVLIIFILILALMLHLIIPAIYDSIRLFIANFQTHYENTMRIIDRINNLELFGIHISLDRIASRITDAFGAFSIEDILSPLNAVIGVGTAIFSGFIAFISSIYILIEKDKFKAYAHRLLKAFTSAWLYDATITYASKLNHNFRQYIFTQTIDGLILGTLVAIQLYILGSPYFLVLGIILGILNYIPYFGSIVGSIIAIAVVMFTQGLGIGTIAAVTLLITQQIDGNIIQPKLMGGSFSLSPLLIIVSITIGGALYGILGMIVAIPIVALLKEMLENIILYREQKKLEKLEGASEETGER